MKQFREVMSSARAKNSATISVAQAVSGLHGPTLGSGGSLCLHFLMRASVMLGAACLLLTSCSSKVHLDCSQGPGTYGVTIGAPNVTVIAGELAAIASAALLMAGKAPATPARFRDTPGAPVSGATLDSTTYDLFGTTTYSLQCLPQPPNH